MDIIVEQQLFNVYLKLQGFEAKMLLKFYYREVINDLS